MDPSSRPELAGLAPYLSRADDAMIDALSVSTWERNAAWAVKFATFIKGNYCACACQTNLCYTRTCHDQNIPRTWPMATP